MLQFTLSGYTIFRCTVFMRVQWRRLVHVSAVLISMSVLRVQVKSGEWHQNLPPPLPYSTLLRFGPVGLEGHVHGPGTGLLGPEGRLMLQGRAPGEEGVLEVVVEQAADGGHVYVGEA